MPEWLYEAGIGEDRAALVDGGEMLELLIERHDKDVRAGAVIDAQMIRRLPNSDRAIFALSGVRGAEAVGPAPRQYSEGQRLRVVVIREAIPETGNPKAPIVRIADDAEALSKGSSLLERLKGTGLPVIILLPHEKDRLEQCGWSERLGEAESGLVPFLGGLLRIAITPAMTLVDIDGTLAPAELARMGAAAAARAIRLFDIGGSIGLDLPIPQQAGKELRTAIGAEIDTILPQPFERTALNGFGFLQIVRRRLRASVPELIQSDRVTASALGLLRRAERAGGHGALTLAAGAPVVRRMEAEAGWLAELARRRGAPIHLSERERTAISGGDVTPEFP